jgi:arginine deiminase
MRDNFSIIEKMSLFGKWLNQHDEMNLFYYLLSFRHHPYLSSSSLKITEWKTTNDSDEFPTIEGDNVAYVGRGVVLIGCSE